MKVIAGDETGLIKVVSVEDGKVLHKLGSQSRDNAVRRLCWLQEKELVWATKVGKINHALAPLSKKKENGEGIVQAYSKCEAPVSGLAVLKTQESTNVISCTTSGKIQILSKGSEEEIASFDVDGPIEQMRLSPQHNQLGIGGKENDLKIWDIEKQAVSFKARNVPHDFLDMRVPVWITDLDFLESSETKLGPQHTIVTGTGYSHVRLYDTRAQRRPVKNIVLDKLLGHVTSVASMGDNTAIVADTAGKMLRIDLTLGKEISSYRGVGGSIRSIVKHPTLPVFASGGLDRCVRVHDLESRDLLSRVYVKQRITQVLFDDEGRIDPEKKEKRKKPEGDEEADSDEDDKDVWDELDERTSREKKKKKQSE